MKQCDVLIVGGGPAGSTCAWQLHRAGREVLILDKRLFPRDKVCAGWITPAVAEELQLDLADYERGRVLQRLTGFRTSLMGGPEVETRYPEAVSYGIRRREFDHYLLTRSGAQTLLGTPLESMRREGGQWIVNDAIRAPLVIGAGGHFCPVARRLGARPGAAEAAVLAKEIEFPMTPEQAAACPARADTPELFFCQDLRGYGWLLRKGNYLNIGLGRQDKRRLGSHLAAFVDMLARRGRIPAGLPDHFHGHAYLLYGETPRELLDDGVLLIGDAAGLAYAQSGEGIRPSVESALIAARLVHGLGGDYRRERLRPYVEELVARFGPRDRRHGPNVAALLPRSWMRALSARLIASRWFARHVVLDRWFLHRGQPPLWPQPQ